MRGNQWGVFLSLILFLSGCARTLTVQPPMPPPTALPKGEMRVGVYMPPGTDSNSFKNKPGSGIWPSSEYEFSPGQTIQDALFEITKRHYTEVGYAESSIDKQFDVVIEYYCYPPAFAKGSLQAKAPLLFTMRNARTSRVLEEIQLEGRSADQPGRIGRFLVGQPLEERALEKSLSAAYADLLRKVDATLARTVAMGQSPEPKRPYRRQVPPDSGFEERRSF
jgi:hypothetical protein